MFYYLKGKLALADTASAVLDVGGVGYQLTVSGHTQSFLSRSGVGEECLLYTHLSVREDGVELFGFASTEELNIFRLLISVSGIGPKAAMSLLSFMTPDQVAIAVCSEDKKSISKAPGIGPKTAARIILELKDKLHADVSSNADNSSEETRFVGSSDKITEALDALTVLGFNRSVASDTLRKIDTATLELEDIIREALKKLMK